MEVIMFSGGIGSGAFQSGDICALLFFIPFKVLPSPFVVF